ncbi:gamma-glutamylcyclotransferase [Undibacterium sp.]|uniref:gamma-glutamylcyclotransferase n=1 Tax=Undibacterium sp. TaxID=1914977 RepID=UPI00374DA7D5
MLLESGEIETLLCKDAPGIQLTTEAERAESLDALLSIRPSGDMWVFGYGSLIWNPAIRTVERRTARINGWHREFCLSMPAGRGSPDRPGLALALDVGGSCSGTAYRIAEDDIKTELSLLWRREMLCGAYIPRWVEVLNQYGTPFGNAITFTIDSTSGHYAGGLPMDSITERLATAAGSLGSSADYLFRTRDGLRASGLADCDIELLATCVETLQAQRDCWQL